MSNRYSLLSLWLALAGVIFFLIRYALAATSNFLPSIFFFTSLTCIILGLIFSMIAISKNEPSKWKFVGIFVLLAAIIFLLLTPVLIGVFGFREP
ncbi:hypothetical protein [Bacillus sp. C1]